MQSGLNRRSHAIDRCHNLSDFRSMQAEAPAAHLPRQTMKSSTDRECRRNAMPRTTNISAPQNPTTAAHRPTGPRGLLLEELDIPYELKMHKRSPRTRLAPPELKQIHPARRVAGY